MLWNTTPIARANDTEDVKVLVADDHEAVCESLRKLLLGKGYQVIAVANGVEAVETFRQKVDQIDLLLVDLNMPMKNGWATLDRLIEVNPSLPASLSPASPIRSKWRRRRE